VAREGEIRFLRFGDGRVAYAVSGQGPPLVVPAWWISHLELNWRDLAFRAFWECVGGGTSLVRYDAPGVGMSDRDGEPQERTLETEVALLEAVLDELGLQQATLLGGSSGGCAAIAFAARFPDRVDRLLLYGAYADGRSIAPAKVRDALVTTVRSHWGLGSRVLADVFLGDDALEGERDLGGQRHDEAIDDADADEHLDGEDADDQGTEAERHRHRPRARDGGGGHDPCSPLWSARSSSSRMPRVASSRRSLQICAT